MDGNSIPFIPDTDLDGDGIFDTEMKLTDVDGDGILDSQLAFTDVDGDGIIDVFSQDYYFDSNSDGMIDSIISGTDSNMDGIFENEQLQSDTNSDGFLDTYSQTSYFDTDGNGVIDTIKYAEDNNADGVFEYVNFYQDVNNDGNFEPLDGVNYVDPDDYVPSDDSGTSSDTMNFDPNDSNVNYDNIVGEPADDMEHWHVQETDSTCAVAAQEFVLEDLTGQEFSESELTEVAIENGWYSEGGGTPMGYVGNLLEYYGLDVEQSDGASIDDISNCLQNGGKVIVGIDADEIWYEDNDTYSPSGANHAVEVIGIDYSDPDNPMVILNDSGTPDGRGSMVPLDQFVDAWEDSNCFMVEAYPSV